MSIENVKELRIVVDIDTFKEMQKRFGVKAVKAIETELGEFLDQTFTEE